MAVDQAQEWLPDPVGKYRFRLYADGRPTGWVSDGNAITEDRLPPAGVYPAVVNGTSRPGQPAQPWEMGAPADAEPPAPPPRPAGWYRNAASPDEVRYWDGAAWTSPPADPSSDAGVSRIEAHTAKDERTSHTGEVRPTTVHDVAAPSRYANGAVPANWYPDPSDRTRLRYWDGLGWTEHVLEEQPTYP